MDKRPNLLFIFTDQQRWDTIRALGNPAIRTPNLDRLAAAGTAFRNAFTPSPECVPARASLAFGQHPAQTGCYGNGDAFPFDAKETYMAALTRAGYRTRGIGKCHFEHPDEAKALGGNGFETRERQEEIVRDPANDEYLSHLQANGGDHIVDPHGIRGDMYYMPQPAQMPPSLHPTQWVGDRAVAFIESHKDVDGPWHAYASFIHPHPPFCPPSPWHKLYRDVDVPPPHLPPDWESLQIFVNRFQNRYKRFDRGLDLHRVRMLRAYYYACISFIDFQVGRLLDALDATGQRDNTLILFSSDHGELLGDYGCVGKRSYHDAAMRVPMLLSWPGRVPQGATNDTPVSLLDIPKTFLACGLASLQTHACEGESLVEIANEPSRKRTIFSQLYRGPKAIYTAVNRRWKYVYSAPDNRELLFDRQADPAETRDLAGHSSGIRHGFADGLPGMKATLIDHLQSVGETDAIAYDDWRRHPAAKLPQSRDGGLLYQDHPWAEDMHLISGYDSL